MNHWRQIKWGKQLINVSNLFEIGCLWLPTVHWLLPFSRKRTRERERKSKKQAHWNEKFSTKQQIIKQSKAKICGPFFILCGCAYIRYDTWKSKKRLKPMRKPHTLTISKFIHETFDMVAFATSEKIKFVHENKPKTVTQIDWFFNVEYTNNTRRARARTHWHACTHTHTYSVYILIVIMSSKSTNF